jgi:type II secretory pathway component PulM
MKISKREKRFLLFGGVAVAGLLAGVYLVEPLVRAQQRVREDIRQKTALLERHQLLASDHERYQRRVEALRAEVRQAEVSSFTGAKLPLVAAEIQGMLAKFAEEAGLTIARQNVPTPKQVDQFTQVNVELSVRGDRRALRDFLHKLQAAPKLLTIPRITIRVAPGRGDAALLADLQVAGYVVGGEAKTAHGSTPTSSGESRVAQRETP